METLGSAVIVSAITEVGTAGSVVDVAKGSFFPGVPTRFEEASNSFPATVPEVVPGVLPIDTGDCASISAESMDVDVDNPPWVGLDNLDRSKGACFVVIVSTSLVLPGTLP